MTRGLAFWVLMLLWFMLALAWRLDVFGPYGLWGFALVPFLLFALIGWQVFGPPLR